MARRDPSDDKRNDGYRVSEVLQRAHRLGPTRRWALFYRHHWRRFKNARAAAWDRPPEPHDWRWAVGLLGKSLVVSGLLMLGFVGYQLWGTGLSTAAAQRALAEEFASVQQLASTTTATETTTTVSDEPTSATLPPITPTTTAVSTTVEPLTSSIMLGDPIARLQIPRIDLDVYVVAGVASEQLQRGPGHFPDTPLPGELGNAAIAGHRTTYGQPFHNLDRLQPGDDITLATTSGDSYTYTVSGLEVVEPSDYEVVATTDPTSATLTLTTCHPKWSASLRLIIHAVLDLDRSDVPRPRTSYVQNESSSASTTTVSQMTTTTSAASTTSVAPTVTSTDAPTTTVTTDEVQLTNATEDAFSAGWFHSPAAATQGALWTALLVVLVSLVRSTSRRRKSWWPALPIAIVPFAVVLYFVYENVNGILPPNL